MKIIVTGGSGFLGTHLCAALAEEGHEVLNLDRRLSQDEKVKTAVCDILDKTALEPYFAGVEAVFHLASLIEVGESVQQPERYITNNVLGTLNVLEAMRANEVKRFLFSSSAAIYGEPLRTPIKEDDRTLPINPYGMTKLAMEGLVSSYAKSFGMTGVALRYFNLYGPGENHQPETHGIPRFISQMMRDEELTVWGDGTNVRDYVFIDDVVRAHLLALTLPQGYHYLNLSGKNATTVTEVIQLLEKVMEKKARVRHFDPRPGDTQVLVADAAKAKQVLGWEAEIGLEEGLKKTVEWFSNRV